ncbi:MAG: hypothetical protein ACHBN1_27055 [Heteroscytonema crispum UTEX LB 1556]
MLQKLTIRSVVVILLVVGCLGLAVFDRRLRPVFGDGRRWWAWRYTWGKCYLNLGS